MTAARVLITGATGFVGTNVALRMADAGHDVHALVRASHRPWRLQDARRPVRVHVVDVLDRAALGDCVAAIAPRWILHLAAYGAYPTQTDAVRCVRTNLEATVNLLDAAAALGVERFINTGSSSEYGRQDHAPDEAEPLEPNSLYAVTKAAATAYGVHVARSTGLHVTTLRLYSVYGPYEEPTRFIPTVILRGLAGGYPPLASPETARDFVYVDDVAGAYEAALAADVPAGRVYNVGTGTQTTLRTVVDLCRSRFAIPEEPEWGTMPSRTWDAACWVANTTRARDELGWSAATSFDDGFRRTAVWLSESEERRSFYETARAPLE